MKLCLYLILGLTLSFASFGEKTKKRKHVKYKSGKRIDFENLLIEGESKKAELSVVTGNLGKKDMGLLRLRENFVDMMSDDAGEEVK